MFFTKLLSFLKLWSFQLEMAFAILVTLLGNNLWLLANWQNAVAHELQGGSTGNMSKCPYVRQLSAHKNYPKVCFF